MFSFSIYRLSTLSFANAPVVRIMLAFNVKKPYRNGRKRRYLTKVLMVLDLVNRAKRIQRFCRLKSYGS